MINLIKAEIYKYSKRPFTYIIAISLSLGTFLVVALVAGKFSETPAYTREEFLALTNAYFPMILILMMVFGSVISEDYKEGTFKNLCASNMSKSKIFISKFIIQIILAVAIATICMIVFLLSVNMIKTGTNYSSEMLKGFIFRFITAIPIFLGGISLVNFLAIIVKKESIVCVLYFLSMQLGGIFFILEQVLRDRIGVFREVLFSMREVLLSMQFGNPGSTIPELLKAMMIGIAYTVILTTITTLIFSKQDLK